MQKYHDFSQRNLTVANELVLASFSPFLMMTDEDYDDKDCDKNAKISRFFSQKSDRCKRVSLGIFLSLFVIAVVFGTVSAFVTNHYTYSGWNNLAEKVGSQIDHIWLSSPSSHYHHHHCRYHHHCICHQPLHLFRLEQPR